MGEPVCVDDRLIEVVLVADLEPPNLAVLDVAGLLLSGLKFKLLQSLSGASTTSS